MYIHAQHTHIYAHTHTHINNNNNNKKKTLIFTQKKIGRGAFGEVRVCREIATRAIYAIKIMRKSEMIKKKQVAHIRAERDVMSLTENPYIVKLVYSFQDKRKLYLVMEFLAGGDLMTVLMKYDILTENITKFYIAEIALAIQSVHDLSYVHRDLKPVICFFFFFFIIIFYLFIYFSIFIYCVYVYVRICVCVVHVCTCYVCICKSYFILSFLLIDIDCLFLLG